MKLVDLFSRSDDEVIQMIIGQTSISILTSIFPEKARPSELKKIIINLFPQEELLLNKNYRNALFDLLKEVELKELFQILEEPFPKEPYKKIKKFSFTKGSKKEEMLFKFFQLPKPLNLEKIEKPAKEELCANYGLFPHQINAINRINHIISSELKRVILHMPAKTYKLILESLIVYNNCPLIGLTATPGRSYSDIEKDEQLANFFYKQKVTLSISGYSNPIEYLQSEGYLAKAEFYTLSHNGNTELSQKEMNEIQKGFDISENVLIRLGQNELRNISILKKFKDLIQRHNRILFFGSSVEHSDMIASLLRAMDIDAYSLTGKTSDIERNRIVQDYKTDASSIKIICNYGILTTGFDAPKTSCAFIARPTKSLVLYSQMVGRAIRGIKQGGNEKAEIITVVDTSLPGFRDMAEAFLNWEDVF